MKVKLDENITLDAVAVFRAAGHDVDTVPDEGLTGAADSAVWDACVGEGRMLVTFDLGFADVRAYPPSSHAGVVVLRLGDQRPAAVVEVLARFVADYDLDGLRGSLVVLTERIVRIRSG